MRMIFCKIDGVLDMDDLDGGPKGGNGLDDSVTAPGLMVKDGERESWLEEDREGGLLTLKMLLFSATSSMLGLATNFRPVY